MGAFVHYQRVPRVLGAQSQYGDVQREHHLGVGVLRPDLVLRDQVGGETRWLLIEAKGGRATFDARCHRDAWRRKAESRC